MSAKNYNTASQRYVGLCHPCHQYVYFLAVADRTCAPFSRPLIHQWPVFLRAPTAPVYATIAPPNDEGEGASCYGQ